MLACVLYRLMVRRGSMPFLPQLGSRLYQLKREKPSVRQSLALQYVAEALREEPELKVQSVELEERGGSIWIRVQIVYRGETLVGGLSV